MWHIITPGRGTCFVVGDGCNHQHHSYTGGFGDVYQNTTSLEGTAFLRVMDIRFSIVNLLEVNFAKFRSNG
jgi:hypothetical protein